MLAHPKDLQCMKTEELKVSQYLTELEISLCGCLAPLKNHEKKIQKQISSNGGSFTIDTIRENIH